MLLHVWLTCGGECSKRVNRRYLMYLLLLELAWAVTTGSDTLICRWVGSQLLMAPVPAPLLSRKLAVIAPLPFCSRLGEMALRMSCRYTKSTEGMRARARGTGPGDRNHAINAAKAAGTAAKATTAQLLSISCCVVQLLYPQDAWASCNSQQLRGGAL